MPLIHIPDLVSNVQTEMEIHGFRRGDTAATTSSGGRLVSQEEDILPLWRATATFGPVDRGTREYREMEAFLCTMAWPDTWARFLHGRVSIPAPLAPVTIVSGAPAAWTVTAGMDSDNMAVGQWALVAGRPVVVALWDPDDRTIAFRPSFTGGRYGVGSSITPCVDIAMRYDGANAMPPLTTDLDFGGPYTVNLIERP